MKYELKNNEIHRDGVKIASRNPQSGAIDYLPDMDRFRAPVSAFLKEQGLDKPPVTPPEVLARQSKPRSAGENINQTETVAPFEVSKPATETSSTGGPAVVLQAIPAPLSFEVRLAQLEAENARLRAAVAAPVAPVIQAAPAQVGVPNAIQIEANRAAGEQVVINRYIAEGAPVFDPTQGDKTPAFVLWLCKNHPDEARIRYGNRRVMGGTHVEQIISNL
jgi:hypothetical protein